VCELRFILQAPVMYGREIQLGPVRRRQFIFQKAKFCKRARVEGENPTTSIFILRCNRELDRSKMKRTERN
jgi:hypothetical protein